MKKGQVTIFIIIAIIIVATVLLYLILREKRQPEPPGGIEENPRAFLEVCLEESVYDSVAILEMNGGFIDPIGAGARYIRDFKFEDEPNRVNITYLCYTSSNNDPCIRQGGILRPSMEWEIKNYISGDVDNCIANLENSLTEKGYVVRNRYTPGDFEVEILRNRIKLKVNMELSISRADETKTEKEIEFGYNSPLYEIVRAAESIINGEIINRNFNIASYVFRYPSLLINRTVTLAPDLSSIYTLKLKYSQDMFRFATRSWVTGPGE